MIKSKESCKKKIPAHFFKVQLRDKLQIIYDVEFGLGVFVVQPLIAIW